MEPKKPSFMDRVKGTLKDAKDRMFTEGKYSPEERAARERAMFKTQRDKEQDGEAEYADPYAYTLPADKPKKK